MAANVTVFLCRTTLKVKKKERVMALCQFDIKLVWIQHQAPKSLTSGKFSRVSSLTKGLNFLTTKIKTPVCTMNIKTLESQVLILRVLVFVTPLRLPVTSHEGICLFYKYLDFFETIMTTEIRR